MSHELFDFVSRLSVAILYGAVFVGAFYHSFDKQLYVRKVILRLIAFASSVWSAFYIMLTFVGPPTVQGTSRALHGITVGVFIYILWSIRFYQGRS